LTRLCANENFPFPVVEELRRLGHDVETTQDAGNAGRAIADDAVLDHAIADQRAVITLNRRHFIRIHRHRADHFGIIVCTVDSDVVGQAQRIDVAVRSQSDLRGRLVRVNRPLA